MADNINVSIPTFGVLDKLTKYKGSLAGSRTILTGALMVLSGAVGFLTGGIDLAEAIAVIGNGFGLIFLRKGVESVKNDLPEKLAEAAKKDAVTAPETPTQ